MRQGLRERTREDERAAEVVSRVRVVRLRLDRLPVLGDGGVEVARGLQGRSQVVVHGRALRTGAQRLPVFRDGFRRAAARLEGGPEVRVGNEVAGILLEPPAHEGFLQRPAVVALARQDLHPEMAHLVGRAVARHHPPRRMTRVADVAFRVVVRDAHVEDGAAGQEERMGERVHGLPGEVPVADPDQPFLRAVGQGGEALHVLADVVRVRVDGEDLGIDGQRVLVGHHEVGRTGRDVDGPVVLELEEHGEPRRRRLGEVEADDGADHFRLARRLEVQVEDEVGVLVDGPGHAFGLGDRGRAGLPEQEMAARGAGAIQQDVRVMHHALVARAQLHGAHVARAVHGRVHHEIAEHVRAFRGHRVGLRHFEHEIGRAELPSRGEGGGRGSGGGRPLRRAFGGPALDERDLLVGEPPRSGQVAVARLGRPGRHEADPGHARDL